MLRYAVAAEGEAGHDAGFRASALSAGPDGTRFDLEVRDGGEEVRCQAFLPMHGRYNVANALAAIGVLVTRGVPAEEAAAHLAAFRGVKRRQEVRGEAGGVTVVDDFAHHPTAVRETLAGLRTRWPERRLIAVFEPRSNTSRRAIFQQEFADALAEADRAVIQQVPDAPIYSATGEVSERLDATRLAEALVAAGVPACALPDVPAIVAELVREARPGDVVVTLSNGGFGDIWSQLLARLAV